jgi:deoxyribonucleoside regulator
MAKNNRLLMQVAKMYYMEQLTQAQIGRNLGTSRATVSRLLQEAREKGIVKISIEFPWERDEELEKIVQARFGLREVRVLTSYDQPIETIRDGRGLLAAEYIDQIVADGMILALSNGRSIASTVKRLRPARKVNMTVVQAIGALGSDNHLVDGPDLVRNLAESYRAQYRYMHAPLVVEDHRTRDLLVQEPSVQEILALARRADVAILGVGALESESSGLIWAGYLNKKDIAWLRSQGSVGHMCAQHFDINGRLLDVELNKRVVGIGLETLRGIETVVAIAGGAEKASAILGAIRGSYIDVLITDDHAVHKLIELDAQHAIQYETM